MADEPVRVHVDPGLCFGSGYCLRIAPEIFGHDDDSVVVLLGVPEGESSDVSEANVDAVKQAVVTCPSGAISITGIS